MIVSISCQAKFILALGLLLGQVVRVSSQDASDLPSCATQCAITAATAAGCAVSDDSCLCSHPTFSAATWACVQNACDVGDRGSVNGILGSMCAAAPAASASASSSSGTSAPGSSTSQTAYSTTSQQGTQAAPSTYVATGTGTTALTPSLTTGVVGTGLSAQSQSSSSTTVVVQTVVLPQASNSSGAVAMVSVNFFGLGLVVVQAGIALLGGILLL